MAFTAAETISSRKELVKSIIEANPGIHTAKIVELSGLAEPQVSYIIKCLRDRGIITPHATLADARFRRYTLARVAPRVQIAQHTEA